MGTAAGTPPRASPPSLDLAAKSAAPRQPSVAGFARQEPRPAPALRHRICPMAQVQFQAPPPQFAPPRLGQQSHAPPRPLHQRGASDAARGAAPPHAIPVRASAGVLRGFRRGTGARIAAARQGTGQSVRCNAAQTQSVYYKSSTAAVKRSDPKGIVQGPKLDDGSGGFCFGKGGGSSSYFGGFLLFTIVLLLDYLKDFETYLLAQEHRVGDDDAGYDTSGGMLGHESC